MRFEGDDLLLTLRAGDTRPPTLAEEDRDIGPIDIGIEESDPASILHEGSGEVCSDGRLPYPTLTRADGYDMGDTTDEAVIWGRRGTEPGFIVLCAGRCCGA